MRKTEEEAAKFIMKTPHRSACSLFCLICTVRVPPNATCMIHKPQFESLLTSVGLESLQEVLVDAVGAPAAAREPREGGHGPPPVAGGHRCHLRNSAVPLQKMHLLTFCQWWANINHLLVTSWFSPYKNQRFTNKVIDLCPKVIM